MIRSLFSAWTAMALVTGCAAKHDGREIVDELPPWMTHGNEARFALLNTLLEGDDTIYALDLIRTMRSEGIKDPQLDLLQGQALYIDGVVDEAERLVALAAKRMPKDARPFSLLCVLQADNDNVPGAVEACRRAVKLNEDDAASWNNLGFLLLALGEYPDALDAAQQAASLDSTDIRFRNNLALAQAAVGREQVAFRNLRSNLDPAEAAYMTALAVERFHGSEHAIPWFERAIKSDPAHEGAHDALQNIQQVELSTEESG